MGYWSEHIMGGDTPSDIENELMLKFPFGKGYSTDKFIEYLNESVNAEENLSAVYVIVVEGNLPINDTIRQIGLEAAQEAYTEADDFKDPAARRRHIQQFIDVLKQYPDEGMTVDIDPDGGLIAAMTSASNTPINR